MGIACSRRGSSAAVLTRIMRLELFPFFQSVERVMTVCERGVSDEDIPGFERDCKDWVLGSMRPFGYVMLDTSL